MTAPKRLFLDASVLIAAAASRTGGSAAVLALCQQGHAKAVSSRRVLLEAERNIHSKLGRETLLRFYRDIAALNLELVQTPSPEEIRAQARTIARKDAHVLAAAVRADVHALLTLDRKHFMSPPVLQAGLSFDVMTPGDFLRRLVS